MVAMAPGVSLSHPDRSQVPSGQNIVEHGADAADAEAKNQALDVKAGALREAEQARRVPIARDKERLRQSERPQTGSIVMPNGIWMEPGTPAGGRGSSS